MQIAQLSKLDNGSQVEFKALIGDPEERPSKGNPFIVVGFNDQTGRVEGKIFSTTLDQFYARYNVYNGDLVKVYGRANHWNNTFQIVIDNLEVLADSSQVNPLDYVPSYPKIYVGKARHGLINLAESIEDERYKKLTKFVMGIDGEKSDFSQFMNSIGSVNFHHNKGGGLAIHTYGVARIADRVCKLYNFQGLIRSRLIFLALVHDIQKREEYISFPVAKRSDLLLTHVPRGASFVEAINMYFGDLLPANELVLCQKALLLHHGEWSNYKVNELYREEYPLEAKLLHSFDQIEACSFDLYEGNEQAYLEAVFSDF
ncbi:OB-fold domain protein [Bacillus phage SP-15]|uniref:OB-fold domain protein n=1 Tax=Bacillus phage SP-15 TaxID=1792032 RepID=A0A127AWF8_9CAUD|nr:OB-fold domain protein [Bacillus phage SP-15]AMM44917.1 OB-fold domain protein [Bacillus phage SP-15]